MRLPSISNLAILALAGCATGFVHKPSSSSFPVTTKVQTGSKSSSSPFRTNSRPFLSAQTQTNARWNVRSSVASSSSSLSMSSTSYDEECDVLVLGSGPAARAIAALLSSPKANINTILADANFDNPWIPNYGVWEDEWQAVTAAFGEFEINKVDLIDKCIDTRWAVTDCYFGGSFDIPVKERFRLNRPYLRVDRNLLRETLSPNVAGASYKVVKANHISKAIGLNMYSPAGSIVHDETGSTIQLQTKDGETVTVRSKLIVDATGHETSLIMRDSRTKTKPAGYQIAYGIMAELDEEDIPDLDAFGPYDKAAMTLFDYRTDHIPPGELEKAEEAPTFMYAMPVGGNKIFFEETSLVARPALSFEDCKTRCFQRLEHLGIEIRKIEEEEFCYIPMGGSLPAPDQRIIAFGGANAMVHPSTGYNLCRNMMGATDMTKAIMKELEEMKEAGTPFNPDKAAAQAYDAIWSPDNIRQRNFAVFGGEFLMKQKVRGLRGFFDGFFRLPLPMWAGFLAGWPGLPNNDQHESWVARIWFGLNFLVRLPFEVGSDMFNSIVSTSLIDGGQLIQSVTPLLGEPEGYAWEKSSKLKNVGDVAAKAEAKLMIAESSMPIFFDKKVKEEPVVEEVEEIVIEEPIEIVNIIEEAKAEKNSVEETVFEGVKAEEPTVEEAKVEEPVVEEAKEEEEPVVEDPVAEEAKVEEPVAEEVKAEEPTVEEAKVEEVKEEEPVVEEAKIEEPVVEEPVVEEAKIEEPVVEEPVVEEAKIEEPVVEEPVVEEAKIEEPVVEEAKIEEPVADEAEKVKEEELKAKELAKKLDDLKEQFSKVKKVDEPDFKVTIIGKEESTPTLTEEDVVEKSEEAFLESTDESKVEEPVVEKEIEIKADDTNTGGDTGGDEAAAKAIKDEATVETPVEETKTKEGESITEETSEEAAVTDDKVESEIETKAEIEAETEAVVSDSTTEEGVTNKTGESTEEVTKAVEETKEEEEEQGGEDVEVTDTLPSRKKGKKGKKNKKKD